MHLFLGPTRRRATGIKHATLAYLSKKLDRQYEIRSRELALKKKAQALEETKFELEQAEKRKRLDIEDNRNNMEMEVFKNQQKLIELILKKCQD